MAELPVVVRLKGVMRSLQAVIEQNNDGSGLGRFAFLLTSLTDEMCEEIAELPEPMVAGYLFQVGEMISWIGHGVNERLPDALRPMGEGIQPTPVSDRRDADDSSAELEVVEAELIDEPATST